MMLRAMYKSPVDKFVNHRELNGYSPAAKTDHQDTVDACSSRGLVSAGPEASALGVGDHVMDKSRGSWDPKWAESMMADEDAKPRSPSTSCTGLISTEEKSTKQGLKRRIQDTESQFPDDGHEDDPNKRPKQKELGEHLQTLKKFACPFYKHDSQKYRENPLTGSKFRTCAGPGWQSVHRVK